MQVVYHKDYEASKGTMTSVADDPEMMRMRQVTNVVSQASYSGRGRDDAGMLTTALASVLVYAGNTDISIWHRSGSNCVELCSDFFLEIIHVSNYYYFLLVL